MAYAGLLAAERQSDAVTLAGKYFVGSPRFVARMPKRFGLSGPGARLRREALGGGLVWVGPQHGGPAPPD